MRVTAVSLPPNHDGREAFDARMEEIFARFLRARRPDLVHFHCLQRLSASLCSAARAQGVPYIVTAHDGWWISERQFLVDDFGRLDLHSVCEETNARQYGSTGAKRAKLLREALGSARKVVAVSDSFAKLYSDAGATNVIVIANGVPSLPTAKRIPSAKGRVRLGFLGGDGAHKGLPLIRAALRGRRFDNLELVVVDHARGAGDEAEDIWGATPVTILGRVDPDRMAAIYARLDVLLAPSLWPESYGLVTREALLCGLWVVASNRGAIGEDVVEGENGFVIDVETPAPLAATFARIDADTARYLSPPPMRPKLRRADEQAEELARLYTELLER